MGKYFIILLFIMCLGCSKEDCRVSDLVPIGIDATVCKIEEEKDGDIYKPETRTSYPANGSAASFASGDNIGVYESLTGSANVKYSFNGASWSSTAPMYWKNANSTHTFTGYYPHNTASTATLAALPILNNQTVSTIPDATCDMLVAAPKTQSRNSATSVPLAFTHAFSLIQFNVKLGSLLNLYVLNNITIRGGNTTGEGTRYGMINIVNNVSQVGYNLTTKAIQSTVNTSAVYTTTLSRDFTQFSLLTTVTPVYFLVLPGKYETPAPGVKFTVALLGIISTSPNWISLDKTTFSPNTKYTYNVTVGGLLSNAPEFKVELVAQQQIATEQLLIN